MKRFAALVLAVILVMSFCGTATADESPDAELSLISCPELGFTTMADPSYSWEYDADDGLYIYTEHEGYIPYVLIWQGEDRIAEPFEYIEEQYTPYMQNEYGDDLAGYVEYETYDIGGKQLPAGLYTYRVQGQLVEMLRLYDSTGERTVAFTAKYQPGQGAATLAALDDAIRCFKSGSDAADPTPAGGLAMGGTFGEYWDFEQTDGTYAYAFPRIKVSMDKNWYQKTRVVLGDGGSTASFYHKASYDAYAAEGMNGGLLFTLGAAVNTDFQNLPDFVYIGFDEEEAMNYYAALPTDYQAYMGDDAIRAEYDELWSGVKDVIASAQIAGGAESGGLQAPMSAAPPRPASSGDYEYLVSDGAVTITKYTGDSPTITIPSEIDGHPVTGIAAEAFRYRKLLGVTIPDSVRTIGEQAFEYSEILAWLELPENVTISRSAFSYAALPSVVVIPAGTTVEADAFSYCEEMEGVCIDPGAVLKGRAFGYCDDLALAACAEGCRLEANAFEYCSEMEMAILCGDVQTEEESFYECGDVEITAEEQYEIVKQSILDGSLHGQKQENAFNAAPEERELEIIGSPATLDGVTVTLETASAVKDSEGFTYTLAGTLENNADEGIMQVTYTIALIDEDGEEFRSFAVVYDGEDTAIEPHESVDFAHDDIRWGKKSIPAAVKIGVSSVKTETELPPANVPRTGEYLYLALGDEKLANIKEEPPVELIFHIDQSGRGRTARFKEGDAFDKALERFCEIKIGKVSDVFVTDNYNGIWLKWEDGTETFISLNLHNLEYSVHDTMHTYELDNLDGFWSYCYDYLEEDIYE